VHAPPWQAAVRWAPHAPARRLAVQPILAGPETSGTAEEERETRMSGIPPDDTAVDTAPHDKRPAPAEPPAPDEVMAALAAHGVAGVAADDEVALRRLLEAHAPGYTLYRLTPAAARRWKARYRIMLAATYIDCQSVAEAYARALLATLA